MALSLPALRAAYDAVPPVPRGMMLVTVSTFGFAGMHAIIRICGDQGQHPFEIAFFRNLFGLVALAPVFMRHGVGVFYTRRFPLHALRGCIQVGAMLMFFTAATITPLAKIAALSFTAPLFATLGAILILGEKVRARRIGALIVGFIGAMIILQPGVATLELGAVLVVASSAIWAGAMLIIKSLSRTDSAVTITAYMGLFMTPLTLVPALFVWQWPTLEQLALFLLMGTLGTIGHVCMAEAFRHAETTAVLPLDFTRLIWSSLLGYVLFMQVPEPWTWIGGSVIFASTTYIAYREARIARAERAAGTGAPRTPS